jgi:hypothetical protein
VQNGYSVHICGRKEGIKERRKEGRKLYLFIYLPYSGRQTGRMEKITVWKWGRDPHGIQVYNNNRSIASGLFKVCYFLLLLFYMLYCMLYNIYIILLLPQR